jgi:hypothetical protein
MSKLPRQPPPERRSPTSLGDEDLGDGRAEGRNDRGKGRPSGATRPGSDAKFRLTDTGLTLRRIPELGLVCRSRLAINQGWPPTHGDQPLTSLHRSIEVAK